jgi:hypothetical protein
VRQRLHNRFDPRGRCGMLAHCMKAFDVSHEDLACLGLITSAAPAFMSSVAYGQVLLHRRAELIRGMGQVKPPHDLLDDSDVLELLEKLSKTVRNYSAGINDQPLCQQ